MSQQPPSGSGGFSTRRFIYSNLRQLESSGPCMQFRAERHRRPSEDTPGEPVLVKRVQDTEDLRAQRRLLTEASVMLLLDHPAIPRVLEVAKHTTGPHLVLEYVEGMTLERVLNKAARRKQPLSEPFAASVAAAVADALHHAHTRVDESGKPLHLVHRGVSPRTIRVTESGGFKLCDFSAVRTAAPGVASTNPHLLKGEVEYAAPELLRAETPDGRADIFSVGLVLVELLTLQHLYDPPRQVKPPRLRGLFSKLRGLVHAEQAGWGDPAELAARAARLSPAEVARVLSHVSAPLREIILQALRIRPEERYATAAALRDALRGFLGKNHSDYGPEEVVREVRQVVTMAARERGVMQTSEATLPVVFRRQPPAYN